MGSDGYQSSLAIQMLRIRAVKEPEESHLLPGLLRELEEAAGR